MFFFFFLGSVLTKLQSIVPLEVSRSLVTARKVVDKVRMSTPSPSLWPLALHCTTCQSKKGEKTRRLYKNNKVLGFKVNGRVIITYAVQFCWNADGQNDVMNRGILKIYLHP